MKWYESILVRLMAVMAMLLSWVNVAHSSPNDSVKVLPDSSNFVTASLLIVSPANEIYSVFGHTAIRMECPIHNLDYVFTFESDPSMSGFLTFFAGMAKARFLAVPTTEFLRFTKKEKRGVRQYELNLTHHEKQQLWRHLDEDMIKGEHRKFNLLLNNCVSMSVMKIQESCIDEYLDWGKQEWPLTESNDVQLEYYCRYSPWMKFLSFTFFGSGFDTTYEMEYHITPELIVPVLKNADLVSTKDGSHRKLVIKEGRELIPNRTEVSQSPFTPTIVFGGLLLLTLFITFVEWRCDCKRAAQILDIMLFTLQSLCGFLLVYITFVSDIFGVNWNWYLIPFNPFPLVLWICLRKRRNYGRIYLLYMVVLLVFMALTPLISQIDWTHQFITASFLIRIIANYYKYKKYK